MKLASLVPLLMMVTLWLWFRGYHGIAGDGQLYAFQALARIHPQLATDLYLQNTSQDQFTIFSPMYAWVIDRMGLERAARLLTLLFTAWFLAASFGAARALAGRNWAWLSVAGLLIIDGSYGSSGVFRFGEEYLTARLPAEAMIATSLVCFLHGRKLAAIGVATLALFVHPLIALPGMLLLLSLVLHNRMVAIGAIAGILTALAIAYASANLAWASRALPLMDPAWLNVVRERSQFLFLQLWSFHDWNLNARPFFSLALTVLAVQDAGIRKICFAGAVIGAAGLAIAAVASLVGPIAPLIQGQAWRWVWITAFLSLLVLPATILQAWRDGRCGWLCAVLLVSAWTLAANSGMVCISLAIIVWVLRSRVGERAARLFRWTTFALIVAIVVWQTIQLCGSKISIDVTEASAFAMARLKDPVALRIFAVLTVALVWRLARVNSLWTRTLLTTILLSAVMFALPSAFKQSRSLAAAADIAQFADWEKAIPKTSTVLVAPDRDVGTFVWFTLQPPNYSALDQSAGVVFSRDTALEVERRSQVLLPLADPSWKILTRLRAARTGRNRNAAAASRPLTAKSLRDVCADNRLGFVISPANLGFDSSRHQDNGPWKDWNLYDCRKVRLSPEKQILP